jgi:acetyl esterase/lipase
LNIWSPDKGEAKKPVLVFIYGGGFETGTTAGMDGSRLANRGDAVVVVPGYDQFWFLTLIANMVDIALASLDSPMRQGCQTKISAF